MMERRKELINSYRNLSNHALVLIVTISAGVINFAVKEDYNLWFWLGIVAATLFIIAYTALKSAEFKELSLIQEDR